MSRGSDILKDRRKLRFKTKSEDDVLNYEQVIDVVLTVFEKNVVVPEILKMAIKQKQVVINGYTATVSGMLKYGYHKYDYAIVLQFDEALRDVTVVGLKIDDSIVDIMA